jgi:head-tail adaptor
MDEDVLNMSLRKFLKKVGVTSQREIEQAVREAAAAGRLAGRRELKAAMRLTIPDAGLDITIDGMIELQ